MTTPPTLTAFAAPQGGDCRLGTVWRDSLLPPNATRFEKRVEAATRTDLADAIDRIAGVKWDFDNPSFTPWLAAEWFLSDFAPYFPDARSLIVAGLPWLRMRGAPAAVLTALAWIGYDHAALEEDGARLHLDPGDAHAVMRLKDIKRLVGRSIPAHVKFYRLYHGYDLRHFRLDFSRLDDGMLDNDSGIFDEDGEVVISFGGTVTHYVPDSDPGIIAHGLILTYSTTLWDDDSWRLDAWRLDSDIMLDAAGGMIFTSTHVLPEPSIETIATGTHTTLQCVVLPEPTDDTPLALHNFGSTTVFPDPLRRWTGAWREAWRTAIPHTFKEITEAET